MRMSPRARLTAVARDAAAREQDQLTRVRLWKGSGDSAGECESEGRSRSAVGLGEGERAQRKPSTFSSCDHAHGSTA